MKYQDVLKQCHLNPNLAMEVCEILKIRVPSLKPKLSKNYQDLKSKWYLETTTGVRIDYLMQMCKVARSFDELLEVTRNFNHLNHLPDEAYNDLVQRLYRKADTFIRKIAVYELSRDKALDEQVLSELVAIGTLDDWYWVSVIHDSDNDLSDLDWIAPEQIARIIKNG